MKDGDFSGGDEVSSRKDEQSSKDLKGLSSPAGKPGIVTARGTADGLILRIDGRAAKDGMIRATQEFVSEREGFLRGCEVTIEWVAQDPPEAVQRAIRDMLDEHFAMQVQQAPVSGGDEYPDFDDDPLFEEFSSSEGSGSAPVSLFGGLDAFSMEEEVAGAGASRMTTASGTTAVDPISEGALWDDPNARLVFATLRSGQRIETEHSLVICGDVNSGAEVVAGGDIFVLGTLRGVAHAGAFDETGGGSFIFSLNLQPTQLRIGSVISRGPADGGKAPEIARVDGDIIVVEPYQARSRLFKKGQQKVRQLQSVGNQGI
jgi:septum formation inhibitor MinC